MRLRVVLDTNVLISSIGWDGPERSIIREGLEGNIILLTSRDIIKEFLGVMERDKFDFIDKFQIERFLMTIFQEFEIINTTTTTSVIEEDPDDNMIIECAVDGHAHLIVSGDRHLLKLMEYENIKILRSSDLLDMIL
jgi:putative PIN family toxin of toxin-antitoxin system